MSSRDRTRRVSLLIRNLPMDVRYNITVPFVELLYGCLTCHIPCPGLRMYVPSLNAMARSAMFTFPETTTQGELTRLYVVKAMKISGQDHQVNPRSCWVHKEHARGNQHSSSIKSSVRVTEMQHTVPVAYQIQGDIQY